jgi:hypothetical protein
MVELLIEAASFTSQHKVRSIHGPRVPLHSQQWNLHEWLLMTYYDMAGQLISHHVIYRFSSVLKTYNTGEKCYTVSRAFQDAYETRSGRAYNVHALASGVLTAGSSCQLLIRPIA